MAGFSLEIVPQVHIPDHLTGEVRSKLAYVDENIRAAEVAASGDRIVLTLKNEPDAASQTALDGKVQKVVTAMVKGSFKPRQQVLEDELDRPVPCHHDPMPDLISLGEVLPESSGVYALGPLVTRLIEFFEGHFLDLAKSFDAAPYRFPTLIPAKYMERVNYFRSFPHSLTFATHLRGDLDIIENFSKTAQTSEAGLNTDMHSFSNIETLLSPAVCYHLYFAMADKPMPAEHVVATAVGNCFRYESNNLVSLERLWNFTMREVIFVGAKDFVLENREIARQRMRQKLADIGLAYRVESASDPFFIGEFKQAAFQSAFQLKFEIRASLPFRDSTLAVGSYNYHQDFFGRSLNISLPDGSPAHTGCVAFGLERIVFAFLAQYGLDPKAWPEAVRKAAT